MEGPLGLLAVMAVAVFVVGPILGILAFFGNRNTRRHAERLEMEIQDLRRALRTMQPGSPPVAQVGPLPAYEAAPGLTPERPPTRSIDDALAAMADVSGRPVAPLQAVTPPLAPAGPDAEPHLPEPPSQLPDEQMQPAAPETSGSDEAPSTMEHISPLPPPPLVPTPAPSGSVSSTMPRAPQQGVEFNLGTKWLGWVGGVLLIMCAAYFLKYAYDNEWIGPKGRIAIGAILGAAAIAFGERFRRRDWQPLFQTLTGVGLATFYVCIFFAFKVYHLAGAGTAFSLAICVSALAVALAVFHNTISIAILAVIGGFLSPVLLSTGENHPYALFTYIAALNLVALGAAYYRRWSPLELLCFAGTALMLGGWHARFGNEPGQMQPALIFISLFYLMFLLIPTIHTLVRGLPDSTEGTTLVVLNALFSAMMFYRVLYPEHTHALGFIVLSQAVLVFVLYRVWGKRVGENNNTARSLLMIALALIIAAVPLHLSRYGIPVAWALEGALLVYVGTRYRNYWVRAFGMLALFLAAGGLLKRLPLHTAIFTPVANPSFGAWTLVVAAMFASSWILWKRTPVEDKLRDVLVGASFLLGFGLTWMLLTLEVSHYWRWNYTGTYREPYTQGSLLVLWSVLTTGTLTALSVHRMLHSHWLALVVAVYVITGMMFLLSLTSYRTDNTMLFLNSAFLTRIVFCAALLWAARLFIRSGNPALRTSFESLAVIALVILLAFELPRWSRASHFVTTRMAFSLISVAWAMLAFGLIWVGLFTRQRVRRILGFALFAVVVLKVLFVDTSELEKVYRIISFGATGALLLAAGYFFQRYSAMLLQDNEPKENP